MYKYEMHLHTAEGDPYARLGAGERYIEFAQQLYSTAKKSRKYGYVFDSAAKLIDAYARAFEKQWFCDNKPHGFDVQDYRLGALIRRTDACRRRILDYVNGKIDRIDELEEKLLPIYEESKSIHYNSFVRGCTVNNL